MSQKTIAIASCIVLFFVCAVCSAGFGFLYILRSSQGQTTTPGGNIACTLEAKVCPDGSAVGRNPAKNCAFDDCPAVKACTDDAKLCPDGSAVGRDANNNCEFNECPTTDSVNGKLCTQDIKMCPNGSYVSRDPSNNCEFKTCN